MPFDILLLIFSIFGSMHLVPSKYWIFVVPIYFSRQIFVIMGLLITMSLLYNYPTTLVEYVILLIACIISIHHLYKFYPYTRYARKEVPDADGSERNKISIIISNVLQSNDQYQELIKLIKHHNPDLFIGLETNKEWIDSLYSGVYKLYPYEVSVPRADTYGMCLFSKYKIGNKQEMNITTVPSLACDISLSGVDPIKIYIIHPKPPIPPESSYSHSKDKEQHSIAKIISKFPKYKTIVAGDINDVAWSQTTQKFLKETQLLDPRKGRRPLNSFPTNAPLLGFPLDQVYCSGQFKIIAL